MSDRVARETNGTASAAGAVPTATATAGPGPVPQITLDGWEMVQTVQDVVQSVPLVAGKHTLLRLYLSTGSTAPIAVRGTVSLQRVGVAGSTLISSMTNVVLDPAFNGQPGLRTKRENLAMSLNFRVPAALLITGTLQWDLAGLETVNPNSTLTVPAGATGQAVFVAAAPLRVHIVGLRYQSPGAPTPVYEPAPIDYALIQSWLGRAYPVAQVMWSQTSVDWQGPPAWPGPADPLLGTWGRDYVNPYLSTLRAQDVAGGTDHRTHYFGLAADGGGFMRGWASSVPSGPDPTAVASGPAGPSGFPWDTDGSYADWYTGHELAHTLGRAHPGFCNGNSADDPAFPYPNGQIAHNNGDFVGYDSGDPNHAIVPRALPGVIWHDLMTYCDFQWLSAYTYKGLYDRLIAEDALPAPGPAATPPISAGSGSTSPGAPAPGGRAMDGIHVVARINKTTGTGQFRHVTPVAFAGQTAGAAPPDGFAIRVKNSSGGPEADFPVAFRRDACADPADTEVTGSLEIVIPNDPAIASLELMHDNTVLDTFLPGAEPPDPANIRPGGATAGLALTMAAPSSIPARPTVAWTPTQKGAGGPVTAAALGGSGRGPVHTVQVSTDNGQTWRTIGVGLVTPMVSIDPLLLAGKDIVQVRVTATNGFRTKTATKTLAVKDL